MHALVRSSLAVAVAAMLAACGSSVKLDDPPVESRSPVPVLPEGASSAAGSRGVATVDVGTASVSPIGRAGTTGVGGAGGGAAPGAGGAYGSAGSAGMGSSGMGGSGMGSSGMGSTAMGGGAGGASGTSVPWGAACAGAGSGTGMAGLGAGSTGGAFGTGASAGAGTGFGAVAGSGAGGAYGAGGAGGASAAAAQAQRDALTAEMLQGVGRVVYFDFDSFVVREDARPVIEGHARLLTTDRERRLVVEGHTDERGGREYNLALGQKRAEAVARSLVLLGAGENQLEAVSFGEERPAVLGSDETAWSQNRRAELKDRP